MIGRVLDPRPWLALLAALLLAVSPASVLNSHIIRPDTFGVFFALLSFFWALRVFDNPTLSYYVLSGFAAGLAVSSKYNLPLIIVPLVAAHFVRRGLDGVRRPELYAGLTAAALGFALTTPFALLDWNKFMADMGYEVGAQAAGHAGTEGNTLFWYLGFLWSNERFAFALALVQAVRVVLVWDRKGLVLLSFPIVYFVFINLFIVRNDRTLLPLLPFLHLLAAWLALDAAKWLAEAIRAEKRLQVGIAAILAAVLAIQPAWDSTVTAANLGGTDNRDTARVWIEENLPPGARIAVEPYGPYVDPRRFSVTGMGLASQLPDYYLTNGFEYLVFSYGTYGRFYEEPARYPDWVAKYETLFKRFQPVMEWSDRGFAVRLFKTGTSMVPPEREGVQWGIYSPWVELLGYDWTQPRLTLYWRALMARREALSYTLRLFDHQENQVARLSGNVFGQEFRGDRWPEGVVRVPVELQVSPADTPGLIRLQLDIEGAGVGRVPVLAFDRQPVSDKYFIGPLKFRGPASPSVLAQAQPVHARFAGLVELDAYALGRGEDGSLKVRLFWRSLAETQKDLTVFLHLIDANGKVRAQADSKPRGGAYPTPAWEEGELVPDEHTLILPSDLAAGKYRLVVGLYEYPSLHRLPVTDARGQSTGDHWPLGEWVNIQQ